MPKPNNRPPRKTNPVMYIFCEGAKTEPNYIRGYLNAFFPTNRTLHVVEVVPTKKTTPKQLVDEAVSKKRDAKQSRTLLPGDAFWVVYDREAEQKYPSRIHAEARDKANTNGIHIALSNVCFEVWILMHFQSTVASFFNCDDLEKRSSLKTHIPDYDKGDVDLFNRLQDRVEQARHNAEKMNQQTIEGANPEWKRPDEWNPYTDVYKLLDAIDKMGKGHTQRM